MNDIVSEMDLPIFKLSCKLFSHLGLIFFGLRVSAVNLTYKRIRLTAGAYVAFSMPVSLEAAIDAGE